MSSPSDISAILDTLIVAPCLCGREHIVQTGGVQSTVYFAWRNYISERAPAADTGSSASEHVKAIGKSGCTLTPGELSRRMRTGTTQEEVLQWIQEVAGITDRDVLRQFYDLFTAARRPAPHTQVASVRQKRKQAAAVAELPSDAGSSRSAADTVPVLARAYTTAGASAQRRSATESTADTEGARQRSHAHALRVRTTSSGHGQSPLCNSVTSSCFRTVSHIRPRAFFPNGMFKKAIASVTETWPMLRSFCAMAGMPELVA